MEDNKSINYMIIFLSAVFILTSFLVYAERPVLPTVNGVPVQVNFGFTAVATPSFEINAESVTEIGDMLPTGTMGFELRAASGSFLIGHPDNLATGSSRVGRLVPQGQTYLWTGLSGTFNGGVVAESTGSATLVIDSAWGDWNED